MELTSSELRNKVCVLQSQMIQFPQLELETFHFWADGMYARMIPRPAGTLIVGKVHKKEHFYIVMSGRVQVTTERGLEDITAPAVVVSQPGTKRAVLALEDSVCMTVHRAEGKTMEEIEEELVEPDPLSLFGPGNALKELT
jgi:hypothetical protein